MTIRTKDKQSYKLHSKGIKLPGDDYLFDQNYLKIIDLDPTYPDVYVPDDDWDVITEYLAFTVFEDDGTILEVNRDDNYVRMNKNCNETLEYIKTTKYGNTDIEIRFVEPDNDDVSYTFKILTRDLWISGTNVGSTDDYCYFAVFKSEIHYAVTWQVGLPFLKSHYVTFDMTPDEWGKDYLHVMIAKQNPNNDEIVSNITGSSASLIDLSRHEV